VPIIIQCTCNTLGYIRNPLGSITYLNNLKRVLHNLNKVLKEHNTFMKIFCKQYGINYFSPGYWRGNIVYADNYSMHVQYFS
jgi:hypothetical protein